MRCKVSLKKRACDAIMYNDNNGVICKPIDSNAMQIASNVLSKCTGSY